MKKTAKLLLFTVFFARWEAETTANTMVFEGQVAKKHCNLQCFFNQRRKNTGIYDVFIHTVT